MYARLLLSFIWAAAACRIGELIQINEHLHVKVEFMAIILGVLHGAMAKCVGASVAHSTAYFRIDRCRGAKDSSRNPNPRTGRFE
jgi:hypothetical protein